MSNRMLRSWTESDKVNSLSVYGERFFTRLIMVVDDYGCFHANPKLLKANLFPLLLDSVREADLLRWMDECQKAGLIVIYEANGKKYLQILDFRQRLDRAKAKYPLPSKEKTSVIGSMQFVNEIPPEVEVEVEIEEEDEVPNDIFFEMFRRVAGKHISDFELGVEVAKFKNKYPNVHANQAGALINSWVGRIGKIEAPVKQMVI